MSTPAIIYLTLLAIGLLLSANLHGKARTGEHSFWLFVTAKTIVVGLLWWGGFFGSRA